MGKAVKVFSIKLQHFAKIRCNWVRKMGSCMSFGSNRETQNESINEKMASTNVNIRVHKEKRNDLKHNLFKKKLPKRIQKKPLPIEATRILCQRDLYKNSVLSKQWQPIVLELKKVLRKRRSLKNNMYH